MLTRYGTRAEASVDRVSEQLLLHKASTTEQPGPHRTNRNAENFGGRFVRLIFYIHNNQCGAEWFRDLIQRLADRRSEIEPREHLVVAVSGHSRIQRPDCSCVDFGGVQLDSRPAPLSRTEKNVAADGE